MYELIIDRSCEADGEIEWIVRKLLPISPEQRHAHRRIIENTRTGAMHAEIIADGGIEDTYSAALQAGKAALAKAPK